MNKKITRQPSMLKSRIRIYLPLALLMLVIIAIFGSMIYHQINIGDYPTHLEFTKQINEDTFSPRLAHTLFAKLVIFVRSNLPFNWVYKINQPFGLAAAHNSYEIATVVLITIFYALTGYIIWKRAFTSLNEKGIAGVSIISSVMTLVVLLIGPISVITFPHQQYLGYFAANAYHNPTYILMRPFALLWFFIIVDKIFKKTDLKFLLFTCLIVYLATSAKPNFTLSILPAMVLVYVLFYLKQTREVNWRLVIIGMGIVSVVVLLSQFLYMYSPESKDTILFAPSRAIRVFASNNFIASQKIVMSVVFPLSVTIVYWKEAKQRFDFRLGWVNYLVGVLTVSLFIESMRPDHGNFFWGPMAGAFILFVITAIFYTTQLFSHIKDRVIQWKDFVPAVFLVIHLIYGIIYYLNALQANRLVI